MDIIERPAKHGWDADTYPFFFLDPNYKPGDGPVMTRKEIAQLIGKSTQMVDTYIHVKGAPAIDTGGHGKPAQIPTYDFLLWFLAYSRGTSVEQVKAAFVQEAIEQGQRWPDCPAPPADNRLTALEEENRELKERLAALERKRA